MKLTPDQLAEIRSRHEMQGHSDYIWADVSALLEHISEVERERNTAVAALEKISNEEAETHLDESFQKHKPCFTCEHMIKTAEVALSILPSWHSA